jgi:hypothetical protein
MSTYTRDNKEFRQYMADFARKLECCQTDKLFVDTFREAQARRDKRGKRVGMAVVSIAIGFVIGTMFVLSICYR